MSWKVGLETFGRMVDTPVTRTTNLCLTAQTASCSSSSYVQSRLNAIAAAAKVRMMPNAAILKQCVNIVVCWQASPNGSVANPLVTAVGADQPECLEVKGEEKCCESQELDTVFAREVLATSGRIPDVLLGFWEGSILASVLSAPILKKPSSSDRHQPALQHTGFTLARRKKLAGGLWNVDTWASRSNCSTVTYDVPKSTNAGQASFGHGSELQVEPTTCLILGAKGWEQTGQMYSNGGSPGFVQKTLDIFDVVSTANMSKSKPWGGSGPSITCDSSH
eukprot:SAG31_NODE_5029_length_2794_cov_1.742115_3_plen_278_part_00